MNFSYWIIIKISTVIDNAPVHKLLLPDDKKPTNINIIFLRPNSTGLIQPADLRYNGNFQTFFPESLIFSNFEKLLWSCDLAVVKQKYRCYYRKRVLEQLWSESDKLGYSLKECIALASSIMQNEIRIVQ